VEQTRVEPHFLQLIRRTDELSDFLLCSAHFSSIVGSSDSFSTIASRLLTLEVELEQLQSSGVILEPLALSRAGGLGPAITPARGRQE